MEKQRKEDEEREKEDSSNRLSSKPTSLTKVIILIFPKLNEPINLFMHFY